ncbi:MAG: DUF6677 family protein [Planctomycetia bacterium]|nr:DUF6677 family protein [Planctomycetia bacterium]
MAKNPVIVTAPDGSRINLRDPFVAGFLAWLIPGAGHLYQGRTTKGIIFLTCILGTFAYGVFIGGSQVVYASLRAEDYYRLSFVGQAAVGLPALPALVQHFRVERKQPPLWNGWMAPPDVIKRGNPGMSELDRLQGDPGRDFDLGTTFTIIAGLLNVLAIYDAAKGPMFMPPDEREAKRKAAEGNTSTEPGTGS